MKRYFAVIPALVMLSMTLACDDGGASAGSTTDVIADHADAGTEDADTDVADSDATDALDGDSVDAPDTFWVPKPDEPAVASVTFELHNSSDQPVYIGLSGTYCEAWGFVGLEMEEWFNCIGPCGVPPYGVLDGAVKVKAGDTYELVWDGRSLGHSDEPVEVGDGHGIFSMPYWKVVPAGGHELFVSVFTNMPDECMEVNEELMCSGGWDQDPSGIPWSRARICESVENVAAVTFELPATGSITVPVDLLDTTPAKDVSM